MPYSRHSAIHGEVLPPRSQRASRVFSDENLEMLSHVLDDCMRIPGTRIRFGLDAIVGLVPALGDVLGGLASCVMIGAAWFRGVPYVTLVRMTVNVGIEVLVGSIPFLGDAFDVAWKANRRNYKLLIRHTEEPRRHPWSHTAKDWGFLAALCTSIFAVFALPLIALSWALMALLRYHP